MRTRVIAVVVVLILVAGATPAFARPAVPEIVVTGAMTGSQHEVVFPNGGACPEGAKAYYGSYHARLEISSERPVDLVAEIRIDQIDGVYGYIGGYWQWEVSSGFSVYELAWEGYSCQGTIGVEVFDAKGPWAYGQNSLAVITYTPFSLAPAEIKVQELVFWGRR